VKNPHSIALSASVTLGLNYDDVYNSLVNPQPGLVYVVLKDFVSPADVKLLQELKAQLSDEYVNKDSPNLSGLYFKQHLKRSYPENDLASNVLGFVTLEGRGYFGVEEQYNDLLAGAPVTVWVPQDPNRAEEMPKIPAGSALVLTIDREIQSAVEEILDNAMIETGSSSGTIVVMDPKTGEILAMTSTPRLNLNDFWRYGEVYNNVSEFNRAISMPYEPGSIFKILTMAAGIDSGRVGMYSSFFDNGFYQIGGGYIQNWDQGAWGAQDMIGCMEHSLNVCFAWLADQIGSDDFYSYMRRFGIGHPTNIDLSNEASGRLKAPGDDDWSELELGTNSFGQGVATTPIQMLMAASALANNGQMVSPHVLYALASNNGRQYNTPTQIIGSPISAQTAQTMSELLATSLERGESQGLVPGYRLAGKTGTAQIPTQYGTYSTTQTNASFIGWGPIDDPRFMVYVWLEKPESSDWASIVSAPVFRQVVERLVVLMQIPPDAIRLSLSGQ
jgi:cell division protein FtsI/penicillin-binding protein 2